ncbi:hypothetical protein TNCV_2727261 [Trichonephila clavipes]|nr:hypothetical protein TNCV_2727261 [Trichonephila clavipes]
MELGTMTCRPRVRGYSHHLQQPNSQGRETVGSSRERSIVPGNRKSGKFLQNLRGSRERNPSWKCFFSAE